MEPNHVCVAAMIAAGSSLRHVKFGKDDRLGDSSIIGTARLR
jgi:hypothetical protein